MLYFFKQKCLCKYNAKRPLTLRYILSVIKYMVFVPGKAAVKDSKEYGVRWQSKHWWFVGNTINSFYCIFMSSLFFFFLNDYYFIFTSRSLHNVLYGTQRTKIGSLIQRFTVKDLRQNVQGLLNMHLHNRRVNLLVKIAIIASSILNLSDTTEWHQHKNEMMKMSGPTNLSEDFKLSLKQIFRYSSGPLRPLWRLDLQLWINT